MLGVCVSVVGGVHKSTPWRQPLLLEILLIPHVASCVTPAMVSRDCCYSGHLERAGLNMNAALIG